MGPYLVTCASRAWFHLIVFGLLLHLDAITSSSRAARLPWADASTTSSTMGGREPTQASSAAWTLHAPPGGAGHGRVPRSSIGRRSLRSWVMAVALGEHTGGDATLAAGAGKTCRSLAQWKQPFLTFPCMEPCTEANYILHSCMVPS